MRIHRFKARRQHRVAAIEMLESRCLLTGPGDIVGDTIVDATNLGNLAPGGLLSQFGIIDVAGDRDVFQFQADTPGLTAVQLNATNSNSLDPFLTLLDASGTPVRSDDDSGPGRNSFLTFTIAGGQPYYVVASGFGTSIGECVVSISLPNVTDLGVLSATQSLQRSSTIGVSGEREFFQFRADASGLAEIQLNAADSSFLDPFVSLLDFTGAELESDDDDGEDNNSLLTYSVVAGQTYFIVASGFGSTSGDYDLSVSLEPDSLPQDTELLNLTDAEPLLLPGRIDPEGNRDFFRFQSNTSGLVLIQLDRDNSVLDPQVRLLDSNGATIAEDDDSGRGPNSFLTYSIESGQTYFIVASASDDVAPAEPEAIGDYVLMVSLPQVTDLGTLSSTRQPEGAGTISEPLEFDFFRFQAQATGIATVDVTASESSALDTRLTVLSSDGAFLAFNDDIAYPLNTNSRLTIDVVAGQTYFLEVDGFESTTGNYSLSVSSPMSIPLGLLTSTQPIQRSDEITVAGEIDRYQFSADKAGLLVLTMDPTDARNLDTIVTLRDSVGSVLAVNDDVDFPTRRNSRLVYSIEAGETYLIEAGGFGISTGNYRLNASLHTDNVAPPSPQMALNLGTLSSVSPTRTNAIEIPFDHDLFQFQVDTPSVVSIALNAEDPSALDTFLEVFNSLGVRVAFNDDVNFPVDSNSQLTFIAQANQTFFIDVSGVDDGTGFYTLSATAVTAPIVPSLAFPTANISTRANGTITASGVAPFRLDSATSNQVLRIEANATSGNLDTLVTVRVIENDFVVRTVIDDDSGPGLNSLVSLPVTIGQILEIDVSGFGSTTGDFSLAITAPEAINAAVSLDPDLAQTNFALRSGNISSSFERDAFSFTAASDGQVVIDLVTTDGSLDPLLTVTRVSNGVEVGRNDDSPFNFGLLSIPFRSLGFPGIVPARIPVTSLNSHLEIDVTAGFTYDIVAQDFSFGTGSYFLVATTTAQTDDFKDSFDELDALRRDTPRREIRLNNRHEFGLSSPVTGEISAAAGNQRTQDVDLLDFQANFTGVLELSLDLDQDLAVSIFRDVRLAGAANGDYELIDVLSQDDRRPRISTLSFPVDELGVYVVRIAGATGAGSYQLSGRDANFIRNTVDQVPDSIANATPLAFNVATTSAIDFRFDRDVYRFVAPQDGLVAVSLDRVSGSNLDTVLVIYDDKGMPIASNDDVNFATGLIDSLVTFHATAGAEYYVEATGLGPIPNARERDFSTGAYRVLVAPANRAADSVRPVGGSTAERALLEAATVGLVSIANGAGMMGDRNPVAIRNAVVEAIATLAKQGKLDQDYLVLILDDAPDAGFVLTSPNGAATTVSPVSGVTNLPMGGFVNSGQFAAVAIVPTTGGGVPTLQVSGYGSNLGNSFQASMVTRSGESQSLPPQQISRSGSTPDGKVQLTFALGFEAIANRSVPAGQTPSFFLATNPSIKGADRIDDVHDSAVAFANTEIEEKLRTTLSFNPLDPEAWQGLFEGVLQSLQLEGLPRTALEDVLNRVSVSENNLPAEVLMKSPVVRSVKAVYEVLKQGADWMGNGQRKTPAPNSKPRVSSPKNTQATPSPKNPRQAQSAPRKISPLGG